MAASLFPVSELVRVLNASAWTDDAPLRVFLDGLVLGAIRAQCVLDRIVALKAFVRQEHIVLRKILHPPVDWGTAGVLSGRAGWPSRRGGILARCHATAAHGPPRSAACWSRSSRWPAFAVTSRSQ